MSSQGSGYDLGCNIYSPDGRVFQIEYADKAVEAGGAVIGLKCKDGVVIGVEKLVLNKLLLPTSGKMVHKVDNHAGMAYTGYVPDGRAIVPAAESECMNYKDYYGENMPPHTLSSRIGAYMHAHTMYGGYRPFGLGVLIAGYDDVDKESYLHMINPAGTHFRFYGAAVGKGRGTAKTEIEKLDLSQMSVKEGLEHIAFIIKQIRNEARDKPYVLEAGWVLNETKEFVAVDPKTIAIAQENAQKRKDALDEDDDDMDED
uniref:Proteasome subunit alpha type n=1 Tax=Aplanochytrium stocchinoi TaxID=215587 RepID=A0A7S3PKQ0_9STRA|mmetsp:Transcript_510/g.609  ORF Transcript_510/g.609 Transcript_510/m.609 type:complete len:258 (+) Transcript_510:305-1078(+)|eukprot:CAMPEP_0204828202 /NCGR_PEP_ID=MMETSP1346-20131115/5852_1 /ASSEMBLY_ACC=CAM_ASM_000771 /TAXON_ID=215587 /ORGANISM="Aplanochytrium stocchinoi, Strain GSBS06" /LENGTH=257 /DNA_ID=CAMNT_0051957087 /DNA_START=260 /DNA_END=1033 /DNA_ORIENTATION=+